MGDLGCLCGVQTSRPRQEPWLSRARLAVGAPGPQALLPSGLMLCVCFGLVGVFSSLAH